MMMIKKIGKTGKLEKFFIIFPKMLTEKVWVVSLMQN